MSLHCVWRSLKHLEEPETFFFIFYCRQLWFFSTSTTLGTTESFMTPLQFKLKFLNNCKLDLHGIWQISMVSSVKVLMTLLTLQILFLTFVFLSEMSIWWIHSNIHAHHRKFVSDALTFNLASSSGQNFKLLLQPITCKPNDTHITPSSTSYQN